MDIEDVRLRVTAVYATHLTCESCPDDSLVRYHFADLEPGYQEESYHFGLRSSPYGDRQQKKSSNSR